MKRNSCLVIGYGSIGKRHYRILSELGQKVSVVSKRKIEVPDAYSNIELAISSEKPNYIVVANETIEHEKVLRTIEESGFTGKILVEKPLFFESPQSTFNFSSLYVGYNLRFHPIIQFLHKKLRNKKIVSIQAYVGQYLPLWRPGADYTKSYSAYSAKGGGVLRDLSHELDFLQFLFGEWEDMVVRGGKWSDLKIDSEDHISLIYSTKMVPLVNLQMNYLDHINQRFIIVNTNSETYKADFMNKTVQINDEIVFLESDRDYTYREQHIAILNGDKTHLCSYEEGMQIMNMIYMAEQSIKKKEWVFNE
ncbi:oxidoreductase [Bacillaceae bacterium SAOS 7]|nr:oxidoreductase [Bacillaceae bacterium SAOS 7]